MADEAAQDRVLAAQARANADVARLGVEQVRAARRARSNADARRSKLAGREAVHNATRDDSAAREEAARAEPDAQMETRFGRCAKAVDGSYNPSTPRLTPSRHHSTITDHRRGRCESVSVRGRGALSRTALPEGAVAALASCEDC